MSLNCKEDGVTHRGRQGTGTVLPSCGEQISRIMRIMSNIWHTASL
jgi:hypothetical protein